MRCSIHLNFEKIKTKNWHILTPIAGYGNPSSMIPLKCLNRWNLCRRHAAIAEIHATILGETDNCYRSCWTVTLMQSKHDKQSNTKKSMKQKAVKWTESNLKIYSFSDKIGLRKIFAWLFLRSLHIFLLFGNPVFGSFKPYHYIF